MVGGLGGGGGVVIAGGVVVVEEEFEGEGEGSDCAEGEGATC